MLCTIEYQLFATFYAIVCNIWLPCSKRHGSSFTALFQPKDCYIWKPNCTCFTSCVPPFVMPYGQQHLLHTASRQKTGLFFLAIRFLPNVFFAHTCLTVLSKTGVLKFPGNVIGHSFPGDLLTIIRLQTTIKKQNQWVEKSSCCCCAIWHVIQPLHRT